MITIGQRYTFNYPAHFVTLPDYSAHRGHTVEVLRRLDASEADDLGDPMYEVKAADGWIGHAWESELS